MLFNTLCACSGAQAQEGHDDSSWPSRTSQARHELLAGHGRCDLARLHNEHCSQCKQRADLAPAGIRAGPVSKRKDPEVVYRQELQRARRLRCIGRGRQLLALADVDDAEAWRGGLELALVGCCLNASWGRSAFGIPQRDDDHHMCTYISYTHVNTYIDMAHTLNSERLRVTRLRFVQRRSSPARSPDHRFDWMAAEKMTTAIVITMVDGTFTLN